MTAKHIKESTSMLTIYSVVHFLVDFCCAFIMFRLLSHTPAWYTIILLYNFCAFAMQMPLGIIADRLNRNALFAATGCLMVLISPLLISVPVPAAVILGLGNGAFHVGAGVDVLNISEKKCWPLGVFVSPGAFGIYFGAIAGRGTALPVYSTTIMLAVAVLSILLFIRKTSDNAAFSLEGTGKTGVIAAAGLLFLVVCLRSFVGMTLSFPWKSNWHWAVILTTAVVFGKAAGGIISDKIGIRRTSLLSLGGAALLFLLGNYPLAGVAALFLFNMTMPLTLWAMAKSFPGAKGFSFGLLTFALFVGFIPSYLDIVPAISSFPVFALLSVISLVILLLGLRGVKQE
ncbi:MAG: MFS transporter [Clostridiaceae bacterium]|nr:MFS transporter [Clostridiaceae bacterium]